MKFELRGLRADNLQAFLALLGVLRVVDMQRPKWRARAQWKNEAAGGLAEIEIEADSVSKSDFVAATAKGARELLASLAESIPETGAVEDAETVVNMNHENPQAAFVGVFAAPPPPSMETTKSPLFLLSGSQTCRDKAGELAELSDSDFERALLRTFGAARPEKCKVSVGTRWIAANTRAGTKSRKMTETSPSKKAVWLWRFAAGRRLCPRRKRKAKDKKSTTPRPVGGRGRGSCEKDSQNGKPI